MKGGKQMYSQVPIAVPAAATGVIILAGPSWLAITFAFCATFALIGAVFALKRTLPVPSFVRHLRKKRTDAMLKKRLNSRNY